MPQMMNSPNQATSFQPRNQQWQQNEQYQYYAQVEQQPFLPPINNQSYMTGRPPPQSQQRSRKPQPVSQTYQPNYQPQLNYGVYLPAQASRQAEQEYYASQQQFVPNYQNYAQQQPNYYPPQQAQQAYMPPQDNRVAKFRPQMAPLQTQVAPQRSRLPSKNPPELNTDPRLQSSSSRPEFYNYLSGTLETPRRRRPITSSEPPRRRMSTAERYQDNKSYSAISVSSGYTPYSYEDYLSMKSRVEQMTLPRGLGPNHPDQWQVEVF